MTKEWGRRGAEGMWMAVESRDDEDAGPRSMEDGGLRKALEGAVKSKRRKSLNSMNCKGRGH